MHNSNPAPGFSLGKLDPVIMKQLCSAAAHSVCSLFDDVGGEGVIAGYANGVAGYVDDLMDLVFDIFQDPAPFVDALLRIPVPPYLASQFDRPEKQDVVASFVSRFSQAQV
ncbi:hypothetical protein F2P81_011915 [Scophthalmus maximus]|uniref:Uncharacterized protein n=1 Tax=Scophthalmus maximus TaxID=52904 RepID=A0A6A4SRI5_SCOMX|nr:hypothetical protein F2P81_011915 [Scophthalmus maximus]